VRNMEQDDRLRERAELHDQRERDKRHKEIVDVLERIERICGVTKIANEAIAEALRDLPERVVDNVERKIYDLRVARWEAREAGVENAIPALLPMPPSSKGEQREPTERVLKIIRGDEDDDSIAPTKGQRKLLGKLWKYKMHIATGVLALGHVIEHWGRLLWEALKIAAGGGS
jgi:hypothetical protein